MRKTKLTFFTILLFLTAVMIFVIIGESDNNDFSQLEEQINEEYDKSQALKGDYQSQVIDIIYQLQKEILNQSVSREEAIKQVREKLLAMTIVPRDLQQFHLQFIIALTSDINGDIARAKELYKTLQTEYKWLANDIKYFIEAL